MQKVLQNLWQLSDQDFQPIWEEIKDNLDGDFPQIWVDRPWHPLTRKEIYSLILVTNHLGFALPRLIFERIAFWIQLIDLCQDLRSGSLLLQVTASPKYWDWYDDFPKLFEFLGERPTFNPQRIYQRGLKIEVLCLFNSHTWKQQKDRMESILQDMDDIYPIDQVEDELALESVRRFYAQQLAEWMTSRDRYRIVIPDRIEWDKFYELNFHLYLADKGEIDGSCQTLVSKQTAHC